MVVDFAHDPSQATSDLWTEIEKSDCLTRYCRSVGSRSLTLFEMTDQIRLSFRAKRGIFVDPKMGSHSN